MTHTARVTGIGLVVVDQLMVVPNYPAWDSKVYAAAAREQVGGPVPTALAQLALFGHRCHFLSQWGDDALGGVIEADFEESGITFNSACRAAGKRSGLAHVWVEQSSGKRTILSCPPAIDETFLSSQIERSPETDWLHIHGWPADAALHAARWAKANGIRVSMDAGSPKKTTGELLRLVDVLNAPRHFVRAYVGCDDAAAGLDRLLEAGPATVTMTDGSNGAWIGNGEERWHAASLPLETVADTNGAGDVFAGALLHGVIQEWRPEEILRWAVATAGVKCAGLGNRATLADSATVAARLDDVVTSPLHR